MKEKFEAFKELLKALREIRYAIEGKNGGTGEGNGNGNNIVLPKYVYGYVRNMTSNTTVERLLEIDYDGKLYDFEIKIQYGLIDPSQLTEEETTNITELAQNYATIPTSPMIENPLFVYTKEQKDTINKNSIIIEESGVLLKLNDLIFVDLYDFITINSASTTLDIQKGQYYIIMHPVMYNSIINAPDMGDLTPIGGNTQS